MLLSAPVCLAPSATANGQLNIGNVLFGTGLYFSGNSQTNAPQINTTLGVSTSSPFARFSIHAPNGTTNTMLFAIGSSTQTATSTLFSVNNTGSTTLFQIPSSILKTDSNGTIVAAVAGTDYANFAYPFPSNATSTKIDFNGGLTTTGATSTGTFAVTASTTLASLLNVGGQINGNLAAVLASTTLSGNSLFVNATTTNLAITGTASTSAFYGAGLNTCQNNNVLTWAAGVFGCEADDTSVGGANPFIWSSDFGGISAATSSRLLLTQGLSASSTIRFGNANGSQFSFDSSTGRLGLGTSTPFAQFSILATSTTGVGSPTMLFSISSTTAGTATTTLFSISNTGAATLGDSSGTGDAVAQFAGDTNAWATGYFATDKSYRIASSTSLSSNVYFDIAKGGNVGIGSTTQWARLSVDTSSLLTGVPSFVVGSSTRTDFIVTQWRRWCRNDLAVGKAFCGDGQYLPGIVCCLQSRLNFASILC
jgi:hypothetical protein